MAVPPKVKCCARSPRTLSLPGGRCAPARTSRSTSCTARRAAARPFTSRRRWKRRVDAVARQDQDAVTEVWKDWQDAVNMTAQELEDFLDTDESKSVGDKGAGGESTGHRSGRRIVKILRTKKGHLSQDDAAHMRKV